MHVEAVVDFRAAIRALLEWSENIPAADAERVGLDQAAMLRDVADRIHATVCYRNAKGA